MYRIVWLSLPTPVHGPKNASNGHTGASGGGGGVIQGHGHTVHIVAEPLGPGKSECHCESVTAACESFTALLSRSPGFQNRPS